MEQQVSSPLLESFWRKRFPEQIPERLDDRWLRRVELQAFAYGSDHGRAGEDDLLDPLRDAARVRAFFVHPAWTRRGIGRSIMASCEEEIIQAGFRRVDVVATLAGEPLSATFGYAVMERYDIALSDGLRLPAVRMTKRMARG